MEPIADFRGARGSNAGDQFHELWALEQVLGLLDPTKGLTSVTVEGVAAERTGLAGDEPHWDGVDCALYFGGATLETARRVEFAQLKYSSDPDRPWSIARLSASSAKTGNNSVLRRLAEDFREARARMQPGAELKLRLISNQQIADTALRVFQAGASGGPIPKEVQEDLAAVAKATGLDRGDLPSFLTALDVSECGTASRFSQRERLILAVAKLIEDNAASDVAELRQRVRELMLPERHRERATFEMVLSWFDIADRSGLFPCPQATVAVEKPIMRRVAKEVAQAITAGARLICLYGPAGCGKTTAVKLLSGLLPEGSCLVLFDCYGAGRYRFSDDRRHLPENAFLQIANDLALQLRTPFLMARGGRQPIDVRRLVKRVTDAASVIDAAQPGALLVLAVDAADNAVTAANRDSSGEPCFVHDMCTADLHGLPPNVHLVLSSRTARVESLRLSRDAVKIESPPFSPAETAEYVRGIWPQATDMWIEQFHQLSNGIPRVQDYAVKMAGVNQSKALDALRPGGKQLKEVLRGQFVEALSKIGQEGLFDSVIAGLATLPPPIPANHLAAVAGTSVDLVNDCVRDLYPGLRVEGDGIFIADEDFEDFIKAEAQPNLVAIQRVVADHFSRQHRSDGYAATHVADALITAGRGADLLPMIEGDPTLQVIADPIVRREVQLRRLKLALKVCRSAGNASDTLKVILIGADANKDEAVLRELLEEQTDLGVHFAWPTLRRLVLADRDSVEGQGSVLVQDAARAARADDRFTARERLILHDAWIKRRGEVPQQERQLWKLTDDDIAARAEAIFELAGPEAVLQELSRWRPRSIPARVALRLIPNMIISGRQDALKEVLEKRLLREPWNLLLSIPLALAGCEVDVDTIARSLIGLKRQHVPRVARLRYSLAEGQWEERLFELILTACELAMSLGVKSNIILRALRLLRGDERPHLSASQSVPVDATIRILLLEQHLKRRTTSLDALIESLEPKPSKGDKKPGGKGKRKATVSHDDRQDKLRSQAKALFPIYAGRLALIVGGNHPPLDEGLVRQQLPGIAPNEYMFDHEYWSRGLRARAALSVMRLMIMPQIPVSALFERATAILEGRYRDPFGGEFIPILEHLLLRKAEHPLVLSTVVARAGMARESRSPSSEKVDSFARFSRLLLRISPRDAEVLFASAIELTKEIDREAIDQIEFLKPLSASSSVMPSQVCRKTAAEVYRFVSGAAERLSNDDFPWEESAASLAHLSLPVGLAALARWADDGTIDLQTTLRPLLVEALRLGALPPEAAAALAILLDKPDIELFRQIFMAARGSDGKLRLGEELARDCLLHAPQADRLALGRQILSLLPPAEIPLSEDLSLLRTTVEFLEGLPPEAQGREPRSAMTATPYHVSNDEQDESLDFKGNRFTTAQAIREVLDLHRMAGPPFRLRELLLGMRKVTALADRVPFLDALAEVKLDTIWETDRGMVILEALETWKGSPAVERWRTEKLPQVIVRHFAGFARWLKHGESPILNLLSAAHLSPAERLRVLTEGVEASGLSLGSRAIFGVAEMIVKAIPPSEAASVLTWYVERLGTRIPVEPTRVLDLNDLPASTTDALARFLFALLSDIDTRVRWRTAHALRRLARLGAFAVLDAVLGNWKRMEDKSFREPGAPFYWLAARLWLVMTLNRLVGECPRAIAPHFDLIAGIATDSDLPHVLIREHAKRAALCLVDLGHATANVVDLARIRAVNVPRLKKVRVKRTGQQSSSRHEASERAFHFDSMDTLPYWYSPVLSRFPKLEMRHFLDRAEYWIMNKWGAPASANWWSEEPRKRRYDDRRYPLWYHRHGGLPTIERYGTYLEWHAMLCTAGELLETHAVTKSTQSFETFEDWIEGHMPTGPHYWISDRRGPTPLETRLWVQDPRQDIVWLRTSRAGEFIDELGLGKEGRPSWIVVGGRYDVQFPKRELTVAISSALVSPGIASALVRALQTARSPYDFRIPTEKDEAQIDEGRYRLIGWLAENRYDMSFDERDPLRHEARPLPRMPGRAVSNTFPLSRLEGPRTHWVAAENEQPSFVGEVWSDLSAREYDDRLPRATGSNGWRLWMRTRDLQSFLERQGLDLIYEVQVTRQTRSEYSHSYDSDKNKQKTFDRILLCRRDGQIEGATGRLGSWTAPCRRTWA